MWFGWLLTFWLAAAPAAAAETQAMIVGHRGASHDAPENTLAAFRLALEQGADGLECDIHLSRDGALLVLHDDSTGRTCEQDLVVSRETSDRLRQLDAGRWRGAAFAGERLPLLSEVLALVPPGKKLLVEIKSGPATVEPLVALLRDHPKLPQVIVISFQAEALSGFKKRLPGVPALLLHKKAEVPPPERAIALARELHLDGFGWQHEGITAEGAAAVRQAGLRLFAWTVDDAGAARRLRALGVEALISNRPGWLREQLAQGH